MTRPQYQLHILIKSIAGGFSAHCLELDLCEEAPTLAGVKKQIKNVIVAHITFAIENDNLALGFRVEMNIRSGLRYEGVKLPASMQGQR